MRFGWILVAVAACSSPPADDRPMFPTEREPCADYRAERRALFGDLHVHTQFSFDAANYGTVRRPKDAYAFARGLDLDFVAVTDHGELLGEVSLCTTPGSPSYDTDTCRTYRDPDENGALFFGVKMSVPGTARFQDVCGEDDETCLTAAGERWLAMQQDAEDAYDRTESCEFTSFVAYEYTNTGGVSNLHRNVVFESSIVPELPVSMFEAPRPEDLWRLLDEQCRSAGTGCDVVVLPHNSNLSNGNLFYPLYDGDTARLRAEMEPVVEVFQHKGDSECRNGFFNDAGEPDPHCEFEKLRAVGFDDCGENPGSGGMRLGGCLHYLDFVRNVLLEGLEEERRIGLNPYRLGFIGSTDTHNGTPGHVATEGFPGHVGVVDDTAEERLGSGNVTHDGIINNPGGLAAVWAEENSRGAIFDAIRRRETFATSGPRIRVRMFAGWDFAAADCADVPGAGYARGVTMGGELAGADGAAPTLLIEAEADGEPLQAVQVIKGWIDADGAVHERVYDVATTAARAVDPATCEPETPGDPVEACQVWTDPEFDPAQPAFYYTRVLEHPTCRWSWYECLEFAEAERPAGCLDPSIPRTVQERAWTSPVWIVP